MTMRPLIKIAAFSLVLLHASAWGTTGTATAQTTPGAAPVVPVEQEEIPTLGRAPVVVELFSSQACAFCPRADRLFADIVEQDNVIGLACHVDYFDVNTGSLARPFCTERQTWYMEKLFAGPNYTPQMVINGRTDVVGYKFGAVVKALQKAAHSEVQPIGILETGTKGTYKIQLPPGFEMNADTRLWLALYDKPHDLTIAEGRNKGQKANYMHIVSKIGSTDKLTGDIYVTPPAEAEHEGFAVLLQDMKTGRIYGAAEHELKNSTAQQEPDRQR